jgi:hypothetical protein
LKSVHIEHLDLSKLSLFETMKRSISICAFAIGLIVDPIHAAKMLRFASPLQSLTIPDREVKEEITTKRARFLPRFKAGLQSEVEARRELAAKRTSEIQAAATSGSDWAQKAVEVDRARRAKEDEVAEQAFDEGVAQFEKKSKKGPKAAKSPNSYQFVGVVNRKGDKPITWYARPKPSDSKWAVRLLHVNQDAIVKDLFNRGKIDIFAKYKNTGSTDEETKVPIVTSTYQVKERSLK